MLHHSEVPRQGEEKPLIPKYRFDVRPGVDPKIAIQTELIKRSGLEPMSWVRAYAGKFRNLVTERKDLQIVIDSGVITEWEMQEIERHLSA